MKRIISSLAAIALTASLVLVPAVAASASNLGQMSCTNPYLGTDYTPAAIENVNPPTPLGLQAAIDGGWRPLTGPSGSVSLLGVRNVVVDSGNFWPEDVRIEILNGNTGAVSPGAWYTIPAYPQSDYTAAWLLSSILWQNNTGNSWRVQYGRPFEYYQTHTLAAQSYRCT